MLVRDSNTVHEDPVCNVDSYKSLVHATFFWIPSNRVISSLEGKFGTVGDTFVLVQEPLFMKISNLCKNHL
jgi:hypothetical protein